MTSNHREKQSEGTHEPMRHAARRSRTIKRSIAVAPVILACSLVLSGYMAFASSPEATDAAVNESQEVESTPQEEQTDPEQETADTPEESTAEEVVVGQYIAVSGSDEAGRAENIRLAAESIDGYVIEPGATLSFNELVGNIEADERYQDAPVVSSDGMVYGRGGGACQVSSALYLAALYTDLRIVERHPHSTVVDYTPIGLDATVVYGIMDLKIANDSEHPVSISAIAEGQTVTVQIIGQALEEGVFIEPISVLLEYHEAGTPVPNAVEWDPVLENTSYYVVESYREYYYHGSKIESVLLSKDMYEIFSDTTVRMPDGSVDSTK